MFRDRTDAGHRLGAALAERHLDRPVVLALPRGGVPVAAGVAAALGVDLDVVVARKVGAPGRAELGVGALAEGGAEVLDTGVVAALGISEEDLARTTAREHEELRRRVAAYRGDRALPDLTGHTVVVVDDGLATGVTAEAALVGLRGQGASRLVLAVPVGAPDAVHRLERTADLVVCLETPREFRAVGQWYERFGQTSDDEVLALLGPPGGRGPGPARAGPDGRG